MAGVSRAAGGNVPLAWELLVTDGHVRAARVRWMQPWLVALALIFIFLSIYLALVVHPTAHDSGLSESGGAEDAGVRLRDRVAATERLLPSLGVAQEEGRTLPLLSDVGPHVVTPLLAELNRSGRLGNGDLPVATRSIDDFWRKPWPHDASLVGAGSGDVRLVGAVINRGNAAFVSGGRWLGIFRKRHGEWQVASAEDAGFLPATGYPATALEAIPLTLRPVLPQVEEAERP